MNGDRDFDRMLTRWLDDGADLAPERYVWAALEEVDRKGQRETWGARLEATAMKVKPAAPLLGVAAVIVLALATIRLLGDNTGVPTPTSTPTFVPATPEPSPTSLPVTSLQEIVIGESLLAKGWTLDQTIVDRSAVIMYPTRSEDASADARAQLGTLVAGIVTEITGSGDDVYMSWVAEFRTEEDADRMLAFYLEDFESRNGWGLTLDGTSTADAPEGANFVGRTTRLASGAPSGDPVPAAIRIWRAGNVLVAIGGFFQYDERLVHFLGDSMAARARSYAGIDISQS
jgi:hypothetical protein